jgi:hypothetical protein
MAQAREVTLIKQIEGNKITWLLDGIGKIRGKPLEQEPGCKWIRGNPGCWEVSEHIAQQCINRNIPVSENIL